MENLAFDEQSYEMIDGQVVMMSPRPAYGHIQTAGNIYRIFANYLDGKRCMAFPDGMSLYLDENNFLIPDAMIVCEKEKIRHKGIYGVPDLVVEVLSASTAKYDRGKKKEIYEQHGVKEYWIVSPESRSIEVYLLREGRFVLDNVYQVYPEWEWEDMTEEARTEAQLPLKVSLYDDFFIDIREIFKKADLLG